MPKTNMPLFDKYMSLPAGKRRLIRDKYRALFYPGRVFFYKLKNQRPMINAEKIFFNENLING